MRHVLRIPLLIATLLLAIVVFGSATTAHAGTFSSHRCNDLADGEEWWWDTWGIPNWGLIGDGCPGPITLQLVGGIHFEEGEYSGHFRYGRYGSPIVRATVKLSGSNGIEFGTHQGIRFCGQTCSPIHLRSSDNQDSIETLEFSVEDGTIPPDADLIELAGVCVNPAGCGAGDFYDMETWPPGLKIHEIELVHLDETAPTVIAEWMISSGEVGQSGWINGSIRHLAHAIDYQSGLKEAWTTFGADETLVFECGERQGAEPPAMECPGPDEQFGVDVPAELMRQGMNPLSSYAVDRVGNVASDVQMIKFDSVAPNRPSGVIIKPGRFGWVNDLEARVEWNNTGETLETSERSGIYAARIDIDPVEPGLVDPPAILVEGDAIDEASLEFPSNGDWTVLIETVDRAGNVSPPANLAVGVDVDKPGAADFAPLDPITASDRQTGRTIAWTWPTVGPSGICGSTFDVNGDSSMNPNDNPATPSVVGGASQSTLSTGQIDAIGDGLKYVHVRAFSCAGRGSDVGREPIQVDTSLPVARLEPADGWLNPGERARIVAEDESDKGEQSGVSRIEYSIAGNVSSVDAATAFVDTPAGQHQITFSAIDAVGNSSGEYQGVVKVDERSPDAWLVRPPKDDPTLVTAAARDPESGVSELWVEMKPANGGEPIQLGSRHRVENPSTSQVSIDRRIPDDASAATGAFVLEVHAVDATGKHSISQTWQDGSAANVSVPLRERPVVEIEVGSPKTGFSKVHRSPFGLRRIVRGRVVQNGGRPVAGVPLALRIEQQGRAQTQLDSVTTGSDGSFSYGIDAKSSRRLIAAFAGTATLGPASASAELKVSGAVKARPSRRIVRRGQQLVVTGRVLSGDAAIPDLGKLVTLKYKLGRRWRSHETVNTFDDGTFAIPFRFRPRSGARRITFQVVSRAEPGWPFERGQSREFKVVFSK